MTDEIDEFWIGIGIREEEPKYIEKAFGQEEKEEANEFLHEKEQDGYKVALIDKENLTLQQSHPRCVGFHKEEYMVVAEWLSHVIRNSMLLPNILTEVPLKDITGERVSER